MQCRTCGYNLWNLATRQCPECGLPFKPSDFEFPPNSVKYCCPHCMQQYYGTSQAGHLEPREFECVSCHRPVSMDEMVLQPAQGVSEQQTRTGSNPWLERLVPERRLGPLAAWWKTLGYSLGRPTELMRATPDNAPVAQAFLYYLVTSAVFWCVGAGSILLMFILMIGLSMGSAGQGGGFPMGPAWPLIYMFGAYFLLGIVAGPLWALATHTLLRLGGKTAGGFGRTFSCICYSVGGNLLTAIPCLGCTVGWASIIWWMISATLMVKEAKRVGGVRASFATITPPLVAFLVLGAAYVGMIVWGVGMAGQAQTLAAVAQAQAKATADGTTVASAMFAYAQGNNGAGPDHAARIPLTNPASGVSMWNFVPAGGVTDPGTLALGSTTLGAAMQLEEADKETVLAEATPATGQTTYRFGDFIFCDVGVKYQAPIPAGAPAWIFVIPPAPLPPSPQKPPPFGSKSLPPIPRMYIIGKADGSVATVPDAGIQALLDAENKARADAGLGPIPAPVVIVPATAPSTAPGPGGASEPDASGPGSAPPPAEVPGQTPPK